MLKTAVRLTCTLLVFGMTACSKGQPNVLLVTFDTTRWDHVGYATGRDGLTPTADALAKRGTWFETCLSDQPLTLPSHTSILTGLHPFAHGVRNNGTYVASEELVTVSELLRERGYETHAVVSAFVLDSRFGLDQGFSGYDDDLAGGPQQKTFMFKQITADKVASKAISWLRGARPSDRPFFLWLHFYDPHADYEPPADVAARFPNDPYSAEIHFADRELGRVIAVLEDEDLLDETLVVFTADHGEGLGDHGEKTHGLFIYESTTRVPLVLAGPGVPRGTRVDGLTRTVDIMPTVLDLVGLPAPDGIDGRSLRPLWEGDDGGRTAYMETFAPRLNHGWAELRALRDASAKVVLAPRPEAYDLVADPGENRNLLDAGRPVTGPVQTLRDELDAVAGRDPFTRGEQRQQDMDEETRRMLGELGYVWTADDAEVEDRADPKDRQESWERFHSAQKMVNNKQYAAAVATLRALLEDEPGNFTAMQTLAGALERTGDSEGALAVYRRLIEAAPRKYSSHVSAARILGEMGQTAEAELLIRAAIDMQPESPEVYGALGDLLIRQERFDEAEQHYRKALEVDPNSVQAAAGLGNCLNRAGRTEDALTVLTEAYEHDPSNHSATYNLGVVTEQLGDRARALELYREAVRLDPNDAMSWNNLGSLLGKMNQRQEAIRCIAKAHELDPENAEATYNLGALLIFAGQVQHGLPLLEEALRKNPGEHRAAALRAWALESTGRKGEALAAWRELMSSMPEVGVQVARLELERGNRAAARSALEEALRKGGQAAAAAVAQHSELRGLASMQ